MSHWLPTAGPESTSFHLCSGYSCHMSKYATLSAIKQHCTSERCFLQVQLIDTVAYITKNAKVFATGRPIKLLTSLAYTSSLAIVYFDPPLSDTFAPLSLDDRDDIPFVLPRSTRSLYTDGSFNDSISGDSSSMSSAWFALDDDNFILESSSDIIPLTYPSALRSETFALLSALKALAPYSSVVVNTDCASLISIWNQFVNKPFLPKLLRYPNHLLWLSIRHQIHTKHLSLILRKVLAHADDIYNNQVNFLAKEALSSPQPTVTPM
ncbi:ribonuclease H-like domain-containing protein [Rhizophagus irregularis DAOM 181602=DAOM 197198]|nr:ribonuclease H-like domain-containing protein [Rhizophagus irregularis DAOM 181602=DAOM 197198]